MQLRSDAMTRFTMAAMIATSAALCAACATQERSLSSMATPTGSGSQPPGEPPARNAPFVVRLEGPAAVPSDGKVELDIVIERRVPDASPLELLVRPPDGTTVVGGATRETIVDGSATTLRRHLVLQVPAMPAQDLEVDLDARATGARAHATAAYRFGRAEPRLPDPARPRMPVTVHGHSVAHPIQLAPPRHD